MLYSKLGITVKIIGATIISHPTLLRTVNQEETILAKTNGVGEPERCLFGPPCDCSFRILPTVSVSVPISVTQCSRPHPSTPCKLILTCFQPALTKQDLVLSYGSQDVVGQGEIVSGFVARHACPSIEAWCVLFIGCIVLWTISEHFCPFHTQHCI